MRSVSRDPEPKLSVRSQAQEEGKTHSHTQSSWNLPSLDTEKWVLFILATTWLIEDIRSTSWFWNLIYYLLNSHCIYLRRKSSQRLSFIFLWPKLEEAKVDFWSIYYLLNAHFPLDYEVVFRPQVILLANQIRVKFITDERGCRFPVWLLLWSTYNKEGKGVCDTKGRDGICGVVLKNVSF